MTSQTVRVPDLIRASYTGRSAGGGAACRVHLGRGSANRLAM